MTVHDAPPIEPLYVLTTAVEPAAGLSVLPDDLPDHLAFQRSFDDLDYLDVATLPALKDGSSVALVRYLNAPQRDVLIFLQADCSDPAEAVLSVVGRLGLTTDKLAWIRPDLRDPIVDLISHKAAFPLSERMRRFLQDAGLPVSGTLTLDDIFVYPDLLKQNLHSAETERVSSGVLFSRRIEPRRIFLTGDENSGKTTLLKRLFAHFYAHDLVPVLVTPKTALKTRTPSEATERSFKLEYSRSLWEKYRSVPKSERAILVDEYFRLPGRIREGLLDHLTDSADTVVVVSDDTLMFSDAVQRKNSFECYKIESMGHQVRNRLINKWLSNNQLSRDERALRWARANKTIDTVVGHDFVPPYPMFLVAILQAQDRGMDVGAGAAPSALGYFYELLIKLSMAQGTSHEAYDVFASYLAHIAYGFFARGIEEADSGTVAAIHREFEETYAIKRSEVRLCSQLTERNLLQKHGDSLSFRYPFVYYYFVASYLRDHLEENWCKEVVNRLAEDMADSASAHILLFLAHVSRSPILQSALIGAAERVFANQVPCTLDAIDVRSRWQQLGTARESLIYQDCGPAEGQAAMAAALDDRERHPRALSSERDVIELLEALRTLRIVGQVLRNFPGSLERKRKISLGQACVGMARRTLTFLLTHLEYNQEELLDQLADSVRYYHPDFDDSDVRQRAKVIFSRLEGLFAYSIVKRLSYSVGNPDLDQVWDDIAGRGPRSTIEELFNISLVLDRERRVPEQDVLNLVKRFRSHPIASSVLRRLVTLRFELFEEDFRTKQRLCAALDVDYRAVGLQRRLVAFGRGVGVDLGAEEET
jgi:hypothetical protein